MNFYASGAADDNSRDFSLIHFDSHHADAIVVPDAELLFTGHFHRAGLDLVITGHNGRHHVIADYFASEHPPALVAPNGAHLSPDVVDLLADSLAPNEYAQAQTLAPSAAPPDSIGKVQKVAGTVSVLRNGVSVAINVGDVVYKSDVIITGADSKVGLTFPDGTALELLPHTRMALNEYSYDANSTSNQALFTLVEGTFGFVAGKVAHAGDMKIGTPVATMGIRGTTGVVQQIGTFSATSGNVTYSFSVYDDPGTTTSGSWDMWVQNPDGSSTLIATVSQTGYVTFVTPQGVDQPPIVTTVPLTASQVDADQLIIQELFQVWGLGGPHSIGIPGSGDNPLLQLPPDFLPDITSPSGPNIYNFQPPELPGLPQPQIPQTPLFSNVFIWNGPNGVWPTGGDWNQGFSPTGANDIVIIESGFVRYDLNLAIYSLTIDAPAELDMIGGGLFVTNSVDIAGILLVDGDPPIFVSYGTATIESGGEVIGGALSVVEFSPNLAAPVTSLVVVENFGTVVAQAGGDVEFIDASVTNEAANAGNTNPNVTTPAGLIESTGAGSIIDFTDSVFVNAGTVLATESGGVSFVNSTVVNVAGASITAQHDGVITFATSNSVGNPLGIGADLINSGRIAAESGGQINFDVAVTNNAGGRIVSSGRDSLVSFSGNELDNSGVVRAGKDGTVSFSDETIVNAGLIAARDGGNIEILSGSVSNESGAVMRAADGGSLTFGGPDAAQLGVTNFSGGAITATDDGFVAFENVGLFNNAGATITAEHHGIVGFFESEDTSAGITNAGTISAEDQSFVVFIDVGGGNNGGVINTGGTIEAMGGSEIILLQSTIVGGTLQTRHHGMIEAAGGDNTFLNVTLNGALVQIDDSAVLALSGVTTIDKTVVLEGDGVVTMAYQTYEIVAGHTNSVLINDTAMLGLGQIGTGDDALTFVNEGFLEAQLVGPGHGNEFIIDTGEGEDSPTTVNAGVLEASADATLLIENSTVENDGPTEDSPGGLIEANGDGALVFITGSIVGNASTIEARADGAVNISDTTIYNNRGQIISTEAGSTVSLTESEVIGGKIFVRNEGALDVTGDTTLDHVIVTVDDDANVAVGDGAVLTLVDRTIIHHGMLTIMSGSALDIESSTGAALDGVNVVNDGIINVDRRSETIIPLLLDGGTTITGGTLSVGSQGLLDVEGTAVVTLDGVMVTDGNLIEVGATTDAIVTLDLADGTDISGTGTLTIYSDDILDVEKGSGSGPNYGATLDGLKVTDHGSIDIGDVASGAILTLDDGAVIAGDGTGQLFINDGDSLDIGPQTGATLDGLIVTDDGGSINVDPGNATLTLDDGTSISGTGTLNIGIHGTVDVISGTTTIAAGIGVSNSGNLEVQGATLIVNGAVTGTGTDTIGHNGVLDFTSSVSSGQTVTFTDQSGTLDIAHTGEFNATIADFGGTDATHSDVIDLQDIAYDPEPENDVWVQTSATGGTLTIYDDKTPVETLNLTGTYNTNDFELVGDKAGGTSGGTEVVWTNVVSGTTATFPSGNILFENGHWVVDDGITTLSGVDQVVIGGKTYLLVDQTGAGNGGYQSIQDAVNHAAAGDTILIAPGTYTEQVTVGSSLNGLTIEAAKAPDGGTVTVEAPPTTLIATATSPTSPIAPTSGDGLDGIFTVNGANNVTINGLTINGLDSGDLSHLSGPGEPSLVGIAYINTTGGVINDVTVTGIRESDAGIGMQHNIGILVANADTLNGNTPTDTEASGLNKITITDSDLSQFQKDGIVVEYANAKITGNALTGLGDVNTAENAIEIFGSTGTVQNNIITDIGYLNGTANATGVLAFDDNSLDILGNHFTGALDGNGNLLLSPVGYYVLDSTGGEIENNTATNVVKGVYVQSEAFSANDPTTGTWTVSGNTITDVVPASQGGAPIYFDPVPTTGGAFTATGGAEAGDIFFVSPGTDTLTGGSGGGNTFVVVNGSDLSGADTITGKGAGNTIEFVSGTAGDTLTIGSSNVSDIQAVKVGALDANGNFISTGTTNLNVNASTYTGDLTITGNDGNDTLTGGSGSDTFIVGNGNNTVTGGTGAGATNVLVYDAPVTAGDITYLGGDQFKVTDGTGLHGTDTFSNIEKVTDGSFLIVGPGAYATVQDALDAAGNGDTILIGSGTMPAPGSLDFNGHTGISILAASGGTVDIGDNGVLVASGTDPKLVDFTGANGTFQTDSAADIPATIADFAAGDKIDLTNLGFSTTESAIWNSAANMLTLSNGSQTESLHLTGTYTQTDFALTQDSSTGTEVQLLIDPVLTGPPSQTVTEGAHVSLGVNDGAAGTVTITGLPGDLDPLSFNGGTYTPPTGAATTGTWTGSSADFNTLSFTAGDEGTFHLVITEASSSNQVTTDTYTLTVEDAPPTVTMPTISSSDFAGSSTVAQGDVLTASANGNGDDTITYQWFSSADGYKNPIQDSGATYSVQAGDIGHTIEVVATSTNDVAGVSTSATSAPTSTVQIETDHWIGGSGNWATGADWSQKAPPLADEPAFIDASGAYIVTLSSADVAGTLTVNADGATVDENTSTLTLAGALTVDAGTFNVNGSVGALNANSIDVAGGSVNLNGHVNVPLSGGLVETTGGYLFVGSGTTFTQPNQSVAIAGNGTAEIQFLGARDTLDNVTFAGGGTLKLDASQNFNFANGSISGFGSGDKIILGDVPFDNSTVSWTQQFASSGFVDVYSNDNPNLFGSLNLLGKYDGGPAAGGVINDFAVEADPNLTVTFPVIGGQQTLPATDLIWVGPSTTKSTIVAAPTTAGVQSEAVTVTVEDPSGNAIQGVTVVPTLTGGNGRLFLTTDPFTGNPLVTNSNGQVTFFFIPRTIPGTDTISALVDGNVTISGQVVVSPAAADAAHSSLTAQVEFGGGGETVTLTLHDADQFGNDRAGDAVTWELSGSNPGADASFVLGPTDANGDTVLTLHSGINQPDTVAANFDTADVPGGVTESAAAFVPLHTWDIAANGDWTDAHWTGGVPGSGDAAAIGISGTYTVTVSQGENEAVYGLGTIASATLDIAGSLTIGGSGTSILAGVLDLDGGTLKAQGGGTVEINGALGGSGGNIVADGATVQINGSVAGAQSITVEGAGIVQVAQALGAGDSITFAGAGLVALAAAPTGAVTVNNFGAGDNLDLVNLAHSPNSTLMWSENANNLGGTLTVHDGAATETFNLAFSTATALSASNFHFEIDSLGSGGTEISVDPPLNYATAQVSTYAGYDLFGINNDGIALGVHGTDALDFTGNQFVDIVNGHVVTFAPPASDFAANLDPVLGNDVVPVTSNDSDVLPGSAVTAGSNLDPAIYSSPSEDPASGLFDNYSNVAATILTGPSGVQSGVASAINDLGWVVGSGPSVGFIAIPGNQSVPQGWSSVASDGYHWVLFNGTPISGLITTVNATVPLAINNAGETVGFIVTQTADISISGATDEGSLGFIYLPNGQYVVLGGPDGTGTLFSTGNAPIGPGEGADMFADRGTYDFDIRATGVNDAGLVVGTYWQMQSGEATEHGFVYDTNTHTYVVPQFSIPGSSGDFPFPTTAFAHQDLSINNEGVIVGTSSTVGGFVANPNLVDTIDKGGTLYLGQASNDIINFADSTGKLVLEDAKDFHGTIENFHGTVPDATHSDVIDLVGVDYGTASPSVNAEGQLQLAGGEVNLNFVNLSGQLTFASDGHGGTLIFDPPATNTATATPSAATAQGTLSFTDNDAATDFSASVTPDGQNYVGHLTTDTVTESNGTASLDYGFSLGNDQIHVAVGETVTQSYQVSLTDAQNPAANSTQTVSVTIGGAGNDNFVFAPGVGHDTILNFNAQQDTVELDHFANAQTAQELQSLMTQDAHGNAVLDLGNHDSVTFLNTTQAQLQQVIQNNHILLH